MVNTTMNLLEWLRKQLEGHQSILKGSVMFSIGSISYHVFTRTGPRPRVTPQALLE